MPPLGKKERKQYEKLCKEQDTQVEVGKDILLVKNHDVDFWGTEMWNVHIRNQKNGRFRSVQALSAGNIRMDLGVEVPSFGDIH